MGADAWQRVPAGTAAEVCRRYPVGPEAGAVLTPDAGPAAFLDALAGRGLFPDAVAFLAHALPKREALWWACACIRAAGPAGPVADALAATERYVITPTDAHRRAAMDAAEAAGFDTPAGAVAAAAFFSAGSLAPPDIPPVPPAEHLTPATVANAVVLAAVSPDPAAAGDRYRRFLDLGRAVATGALRWPAGPDR